MDYFTTHLFAMSFDLSNFVCRENKYAYGETEKWI